MNKAGNKPISPKISSSDMDWNNYPKAAAAAGG